MSESKVFMFPEYESGNSNLMAMLAPLLQQKGVDPNVLLALNGRNSDCFGGEGGWFMWIIFLFFLMGWGNWGGNRGWGNSGNFGENQRLFTDSLINNDTGRELLMSAILGNGTAISQLASTLNCDINAVQQAINSVQGQICQVGNQVGMSSQQVINSIQQGNMSIAQQLSSCCCDLKTQMASCCCDVKDSIIRGNYENQVATLNQTNQLTNAINSVSAGQERGFSQIGYATQLQTCDIQNTINAGIQRLADGQAAAELRELQARISKQNDELSSYKTAGIISQQLAPINGALVALQAEVNSIKCAQPSTVTVPNTSTVAVPACVAAQYGIGYGLNGFWG